MHINLAFWMSAFNADSISLMTDNASLFEILFF